MINVFEITSFGCAACHHHNRKASSNASDFPKSGAKVRSFLRFAKHFIRKLYFSSFLFVVSSKMCNFAASIDKDMTYTIEKITTLIGARRYGDTDAAIGWLLTDSRSLCFPEETLFFALKTKRNDGHRYIGDLYKRGVRNFVVEESPQILHADDGQTDEKGTVSDWLKLCPKANFLRVTDTLAALQRLAERHRDEFQIPIVGITGSNGKTMVKEWLYQLLSGVTAGASASGVQGAAESHREALRVTRSPRSYNSQIGVPLSVWLLNEHSSVGLFEAGISEAGEMERLRDIIQPTVGVFTHLGTAHQENFRSLEEKCTEKLQLMHDTQAMVYCSDNDIVARCVRRSGYGGEKISWSCENREATMFVSSKSSDGHATTVSYRFKGQEGTFTIPFIDEASVENSITCAATALYLGLSREELAERMPHLEPVAMRLEVKEGQRGCTIINDSYNSDVVSLGIALDFMQRRAQGAQGSTASAQHPSARQTVILSDIYQSGEERSALYHEVAQLLEKRGIGKFFGIGAEVSACADTFQVSEKAFFETTEQFLASRQFADLHDEIILLKGARRFGFDRISEQLEQKVHETILEVNLNAVVDNLNYFRSFLRPDTKMVCMIKADGYGAGAVEIAKTLQDQRVDYLAVAVADEGVTLRKAGITSNIMVMNPEMSSFKTLFDYDLEPEVYSFRLLDALVHAARKEGITGWPVHIKLDTGMHRLGFNTPLPENEGGEVAQDEIAQLIGKLKGQQAVIPRSVFSHFVGSDNNDFDAFSESQFARFDNASRRIQAAFSHKILRHIDNSAGIVHFPERQLDMCRLGIGLYGVNPRDEQVVPETSGSPLTSHEVDTSVPASEAIGASSSAVVRASLHCVSTLKTTILQLRHVPAGDSVGYSRRTVLERDSVIGAIPIGYADGLNRHLGNRHGYCLVNGQRAPYVGNICMDVAMIDVTGIPCHEGDTVEIFGEHLPVTALSEEIDTIPYEVLTSVSNRVKRVYFQD